MSAPQDRPSNLKRCARLAVVSALVPTFTACVTLSGMAESARDPYAPVPIQTDGEAMPPSTPALTPNTTRAINPQQAGNLHFILSDTGWGDYSGWRLQVLAARVNQGLNPLLSSPMMGGEHLKISLLPDSYHVRVLLNNNVQKDMWVDVLPGQSTIIYIDIGLLGNQVILQQGDEALGRLDHVAAPTRVLSLSQTFAPLLITSPGPTQGHWYGPRQGDQPTGSGRLDLYEDENKIGSIDPAQADQHGISGVPTFFDGRDVEGQWRGDGLIDGSATRYPDGRQFTGSYQGSDPVSGELRLPDGRRWNGRLTQGEPSGEGRLTLSDGTIIEKAPSTEMQALDGVYTCVTPTGRVTECAWYEGQRLTSRAEYERLIAARQVAQMRELAQNKTHTPTRQGTDPMGMSGLEASVTALENKMDRPSDTTTANTSSTAQRLDEAFDKQSTLVHSSPEEKQASGCSKVEGRFTTSTGLSRLSFSADGRGSLWQQTYGGASTYTFDVDFRWKGSPDNMQFDYSEAIYRDTRGRELQRRPLPGGSAKCSYDGRELIIGGVSYIKQ